MPLIRRSYYNQRGRFLDNCIASDGGFMGGDTAERFKENLQTQPDDWKYRTKKIYYKHNSQGYRTAEFDTIDWARSIVVFGCSDVYGTGLANDETLCHHLEQITGKPVVNMGIGGSSIAFSAYNQIALHEQKVRPLAVVNMWTSADRTMFFDENQVISVGSWSPRCAPQFQKLFMSWAEADSNPHGYAWMFRRMCQILWQDISHYECTYFKSLPFDVDKFDRTDFARDMVHPGTDSMHNAAMQISDNLIV